MDLEKKNKIRKCLTCSLCKKLFYYPVTLYCQDTFCKLCLKNYMIKTNKKDCPLCHKSSFVPPIHNFKIHDIITKLFTEENKIMEVAFLKNQTKLTEEEQIKEDIIKNNWRDIINKKKTNETQVININHDFHNMFEQIL